ncbi:sodium/potassium-transporting ATPase subunit alpha [Entomortierella parvispora]|uniref:Sodium/potassium-transporting ATPase subunit alpha n=1 Tax=Entomortierella parvispora TaxID=205924 RepID=A0A9P3LSJ9_9FUNG|nr:sodium/potassium-transporting ATPase subunit alpha [Entomortierella parvispora]
MASSNGASTTIEIEQDPSKIAFEEPLKMTRTKTIPSTNEKDVPAYSEKEHVQGKGKGVDKSKNVKEKTLDITEHLFPIEEIAQRHGVSIDEAKAGNSRGLDSAVAAQRLIENGPNILSPPKQISPFMKFIHCLTSLFNLLLILAGILNYILLAVDPKDNKVNTYLGAILIIVAFINALIEFYQAQKSAAVLQSFLNLMPQKCFVLRDQKVVQITATDLVLGDVVFARMGDKIPADIMIFACTDMKVDNSSLTGETDPQDRNPKNEHNNPLEATNLAFNGSLVVNGEGYGLVIRTGDNTVLGQIAGLTAGEDSGKSPLSQEIDDFVKIIATIAISTAIIFFLIGYFAVYQHAAGGISNTLNFAIGIFVAWVPEGLPATVTMLLTIAAKRMASQNVLVKDLTGVETLGAITLLATDKTGTLTRNQMTVTNIWSSNNMYSAFRSAANAGSPFDASSPGIPEVLSIAALCSRAKFDRTDVPIPERQVLGDATESGLIRFASSNIGNFDDLSDLYPKVFEVPFNSENKWAMTIHNKEHADGRFTLLIKGAPERILRLCSTILMDGKAVPLTEAHSKAYDDMYALMASKGHRVLAFAQFLLPRDQYPDDHVFDKEKKNYPTTNLTFVGLVSLEDPPKHGVREAIGRCRSAGIRVMMVTGDHPLTAEAIGRKINLVLSDTKEMVAKQRGCALEEVGDDEYNAIVIHGEQIDSLTEYDWDLIFSKPEVIFARTSPKHKLQIVKHAQAMGHIVGVTGDGVNDSPALKKADLGIAMNISGSDVSKEAAAMILLDDNFASTVRGIEEGRLIFTNLKKSIQYTITHSMPEVIPNLLYVIASIPLPITAMLILVIDLGFELFISLTFAWDKPESETGLMRLPPRKPVTPASIERRRRLATRALPPVFDVETNEEIKPTFMARFKHDFNAMFTSIYWREKFEHTEDEILVDAGLLSWAYLEIGIIETIGALATFFVVLYKEGGYTPAIAVSMQRQNLFDSDSPDTKAVAVLQKAQSSFYLGIMIMQLFNMFACKTRYTLPFGKYMFSNYRSFIGIAAGCALAFFIVYCPGLPVVFNTNNDTAFVYLLIPVAFGVFIIFYASARQLLLRKFRPTTLNDEIIGLNMVPTIKTIFSRTKSMPQPSS